MFLGSVFWTMTVLLSTGVYFSVKFLLPQISRKRERFIRDTAFPEGLLPKLVIKHPHLSLHEAERVADALRQFFLTYQKSKYRTVAMPSEIVDSLWHDLILYTRFYEQFCKNAFGRFFHHTPAVALSRYKKSNEGLRRVWWYACKEENIDPKNPQRLPLLFAIDAQLNITGWKTYTLDCAGNNQRHGGNTYCVGDFSDSSVDGCTEGFNDTETEADSGGSSDGGDSGGCSGGCGGGD